jgi:hypothetical protein
MRTFDYKGGEKLKTRLQEILKKVTGQHEVKVGFLEGATYPDGTPVAEVAAYDEFGRMVKTTDGGYFQMPRPFFRNMVQAEQSGWGKTAAKLLKKHDYDVVKVLGLMGEGVTGQLRQSIKDTNTPPLAESTIKAKGFDKPLIHTSHMMNSAGYQVDDGDQVVPK